ncbi:MAG: lyase [Paenibacillus sp.]|jgi:hypothetical protein|nr:lyase [Paenibacillus sp.]
MNIVSIEPTPSPNTMKVNMDESLPKGVKRTYKKADIGGAPDQYRRILDIPGVTSLFHTADFIAVDRTPKGDWQAILASIRSLFGSGESSAPGLSAGGDMLDSYGEATVRVQMFRGIPMQIRVRSGIEEVKQALPERFAQAALQAGSASLTLLKERRLEDIGIRYGELQEIAEQVVQEVDASFTDDRLAELVQASLEAGVGEPVEQPAAREPLSLADVEQQLQESDWKRRYAALAQLKPTIEALPVLAKAIRDPQSSVRRLAAVYLGDIREPQALPYLFEALRDESVSVRRTAGDTLSDIGDPLAIGPMAEALRDKNKLVRWRAARFLYEAGDESALPALQAAADDDEFEVRMQVKMAIERIEGGAAAEGSVWQQMTRRNQQ